jgi:hypothetical protein
LAQSNVYSVNVVGYINYNLPTNGTYLIANQLDLDGTGTNNTLQSVLGTSLPNTTTVYVWDGAGWNWNAKLLAGNWTGNTNITTGKKGTTAGRCVLLAEPYNQCNEHHDGWQCPATEMLGCDPSGRDNTRLIPCAASRQSGN